MADDTTDAPTPSAISAKPATRRRAAPRKTAGTSKPAAKPATASTTAGESAAAKPARAKPGPKPGTKRATPAKPRSTSRAKPAAARRKPAARTSSASSSKDTGSKWGVAATVAGGIAAVGAVGAALFSLRGSTPKDGKPERAHTADGSDASKSFQAGIADENTIPDKG